MAVFLAGVGTATLMDGDDIFVTADTLTDSSITLDLSLEEVRGGQGNRLLGRFAHTSTFGLTLTDALFNLEYLAASVGSELEKGGDVFRNEELTTDGDGKLTLTATAVPFRTGSPVYAYVVKADALDKNKRQKYVVAGDNTVSGLEADTAYCVRYMYTNASADKLVINADFIPGTYYCYLTANLYSGDSTNASTGTKVGEITIKVPRFMLNGTQELSMTATGAATTSLEGTALASGATGCEGQGIYAEIVQVMFDERWYTDAQGLVIEDSYIEATAAEYQPTSPVVYAWYPNAKPKMISNAILAAQESDLAQGEKSKLVFSITDGGTGLQIDSSTGALTLTGASASAGTALITVEAQMNDGTPIPGMDASATIVLA